MKELLINGHWVAGEGWTFDSTDPASGETLWEGASASAAQVASAVVAARGAALAWSLLPQEQRTALIRRFGELLAGRRDRFAEIISRETGKLLGESLGEVDAMIGKIQISITAQEERAGTRSVSQPFGSAVLRHRPHGVMAVLGPYNFPGHLPNGHIVPALLAGNAVVFKPSEKTPLVGQSLAEVWAEVGLPEGVFQLLQGDRATGTALMEQDIDGLLFTGSAAAGAYFRQAFANRPNVVLALELGGNNPLIVWDEGEAAASIIVQSAFITTGQRCSCARRLIIPTGKSGAAILDALAAMVDGIGIAAWNESREAFMGPLIDRHAALAAKAAASDLAGRGARVIRPLTSVTGRNPAFVTPGVVEIDPSTADDLEIFAPLLQVIRADSFDAAIQLANATRFGLSAGLVSGDEGLWDRFLARSRAGIVNRNRPTTGASGSMPFGGLGESGNHRPSAYYAADYCAYPVASFESAAVIPVAL